MHMRTHAVCHTQLPDATEDEEDDDEVEYGDSDEDDGEEGDT